MEIKYSWHNQLQTKYEKQIELSYNVANESSWPKSTVKR